LIESEAVLYKKVGPALIKMSKEDISTEVKGRIEVLSNRLFVNKKISPRNNDNCSKKSHGSPIKYQKNRQ